MNANLPPETLSKTSLSRWAFFITVLRRRLMMRMMLLMAEVLLLRLWLHLTHGVLSFWLLSLFLSFTFDQESGSIGLDFVIVGILPSTPLKTSSASSFLAVVVLVVVSSSSSCAEDAASLSMLWLIVVAAYVAVVVGSGGSNITI
jgi:hypothetical protein